jgi:hypothetical protein
LVLNQIKITIPQFLTHCNKSSNKYQKLNNQGIYSGSINRFTRAKIVNDLHDYLSLYMIPYKGLNITKVKKITYKIYTVINHGSISMRSGKICWKPATKNYIPTWDIENLATLWIKTGNDTLVLNNVIKDDNVSILTEISYKFIKVDELTERKIEIIIDY